jgi:hypothetical protein
MSSHVRKMLLAPIPVVVVILLFIGMRLTQSTVDGGDQVSTLPQSTLAVAASFPAATTSKPMVFTATKQYAEPSAEWIKANALVPSVDGPGATLKLTPRAIAAVTMGVQRPECPRRYVFVNTHTFGRHHNQLQEMLNLAIWARSLNRTAVVGWFRHSHKWTPMDSLYDFSALQRDYCVVSVATFASEWKTVADKSAVCVGQDIKSTPIKAYVRCRLLPGVPAHYDARYGVTSTKPFIGLATSEPSVTAATFLGLSGEIAFFIRPGLLEQVAASMRVQPVPEIVEEARSFAAKAGLRLDGGSEDPSAARATATSTASSRPAPYFALHLRQREKECMKEMNHSWTDSQGLLSGLTEETRRRISGQCAVTVAQLDDMLAALGLTVGDKGASEAVPRLGPSERGAGAGAPPPRGHHVRGREVPHARDGGPAGPGRGLHAATAGASLHGQPAVLCVAELLLPSAGQGPAVRRLRHGLHAVPLPCRGRQRVRAECPLARGGIAVSRLGQCWTWCLAALCGRATVTFHFVPWW